MSPEAEAARDPSSLSTEGADRGGVPIGAAAPSEIGGLIELFALRPPAFWMRRVTRADLATYLEYTINSPRAVLLVARPHGALKPAGYVLAIIDANWYWVGIARKHPALASRIAYLSLVRQASLRLGPVRSDVKGPGDASLPPFVWSPSDPRHARILGLLVAEEHRRKGIAMDLYFKLFDTLRSLYCSRVEEYMGEDYPLFAGKFPDVCGWQVAPCSSGGFKLSRDL